jgi:hypothetical protein
MGGAASRAQPCARSPHRVRCSPRVPSSARNQPCRWHHGSPAHRYSLYALHWITEVNGRPVRDLDAFLAAVAPLGDGDAARLKLVHFETTKEKMITLKTDLRFWPTWKLRLDPARGEWTRVGGAPPR